MVITSSLAAVASYSDPQGLSRTFTEQDWNETSVKIVEEKGIDAGFADVYSASKTLAERGASEGFSAVDDVEFLTFGPASCVGFLQRA